MNRLCLHLAAIACCLPLLAVGCTGDASGEEEIGASDSTGSEDSGDDTTAATSTSDDTTSDDTSTSDTTADTSTDDTTSDSTDTSTDTSTTETTGGVCGDLVIDMGEDCETGDLGGMDCIALGYAGGELLCAGDCSFDVSGCYEQECGNGVVEVGEDCDGTDFGDLGCVDFGSPGGELVCADDCTVISDACTLCGNSVIDEGEICDGSDLDGQTCVGLGYLGGSLACTDVCDGLVESACANSWWGEDFEGGDVLPAEWVLTGNANWFGSATTPYAGGFGGESGNIGDNQQSHMQVTLDFVAAGTVRFWRRTDSEAGYDFLRFHIDGVQQVQWSGNLAWGPSIVYNLAAGSHTLRWTYVKDVSVSTPADAVWVDDIITTNAFLP